MTRVRSNTAAAVVAAVALVLGSSMGSTLRAAPQASATPGAEAPGPQERCAVVAGEPTRVLSGTIADAQGARIPNAVIVVECPPFRQQTQSSAEGVFSVRVPAGTFHIRVDSVGFESSRQTVVVAADRDADDST